MSQEGQEGCITIVIDSSEDDLPIPPGAFTSHPTGHEPATKKAKVLIEYQESKPALAVELKDTACQFLNMDIENAVEEAIGSSSVQTNHLLVSSQPSVFSELLVPSLNSTVPSGELNSAQGMDTTSLASNGKAEIEQPVMEKISISLPVNNSAGSTVTSSYTAVASDEVDDLLETVSIYVKLDELPRSVGILPKLNQTEIEELELALQLDPNVADEGWKDDWNGNLMLITKEISNPVSKRRKSGKSEWTQPLWEWAKLGGNNMRLARNLLAFVYHTKGTPPTAKRIFAYVSQQADADPFSDIFDAVKRVTYDPCVLREDGWTTAKSRKPQGASGGAFHIGSMVHWQGYEAVVIAYVHDDEFGDLWKAMWFEGFETFDLEAGELQEARKKWERRNKDKTHGPRPRSSSVTGSSRFSSTKTFTVEGIEHGIVLATTYNPLARPGVFWPARVMHVSELERTKSHGNKRNSSKGKINVVFLCPYWNSINVISGKPSGPGSFADSPLIEMDTIEVSEQTIQKYPYDGSNGLNIRQFRVAFRFTGLPKHMFSRFVDSHRLALALKTYAQTEVKAVHTHQASAALFDTHFLAIQTAQFPSALLHLPFKFILNKLPVFGDEKSAMQEEDMIEPVLHFSEMLNSMAPPHCWGQQGNVATPNARVNNGVKSATIKSPVPKSLALGSDRAIQKVGSNHPPPEIVSFASQFLVDELTALCKAGLSSSSLLDDLGRMVSRMVVVVSRFHDIAPNLKFAKLSSLLQECLRLKYLGEESLASDKDFLDNEDTLKVEWRKCCERIFRSVTINCSSEGFGNGVTVVQSDTRCNEHVTGNCVERSVRLPAALKGARLAGAGKIPSFILSTTVDNHYIELAETCVINKAHSSAYLKRIKSRCLSLAPDATGEPLTADSDGNGGDDTNGSRGTWNAAVAGVAAAIKAVDMIVGGMCVNVFCATRPPGHHAGRELHAMTAVSNGFCILNPAACAAIYATTPQSEGGMGLKRVCVLDWDVHHGNGTQDILCATHDPRFLYISLHAGGALINGYASDDSDNEYRRAGSGKLEGIYPGRCGDNSPHRGVLNIPLGARVTPHEVGHALVSQVEPAVEEFAPDLIILSAGFDAHKHDPLGMGGLSADDFGHITEVACAMAFKCCSGRIMSILEGGYGVPCCRPQESIFLPPMQQSNDMSGSHYSAEPLPAPNETGKRVQTLKLTDLGQDLPANMDDQVHPGLQKRLEKCHQEGFIDCVREHVLALKKNNSRNS